MSTSASARIPLRLKDERITFCDQFFAAVKASTRYRAPNYREYELPRDVDKELTDRPYYWLWVEQTGQEVEPTRLRLAFTSEALERENERLHDEAWANVNAETMTDVERMFFRPPTAELLSLGGFRLDKIINSVLGRGQVACVRPKHCTDDVALVPWLLLNAVVSYKCDFTKQEFVSLGVCLLNQQIVDGFFDAISHIPMESVTVQTLAGQSPGIKGDAASLLEDGFLLLQQHLNRKLVHQPHRWAEEARQRLDDDLEQLDVYYASLLSSDPEADEPVIRADHQRKRRELISRAEPKIEISISQAAVVGLVEKA
ncbi:YqhG family protein [Alicyclobacillus sp. SO9]|uniref:YqhG family protein n=1 Tax=Alicyclobacillus sp. SO9 TaxID=2665646 RepID=UPI0018E703EF|nr:YqhG family protein [Alicyclobacillus sp. SO9]QQE76987.1 hypothetical protein GI364_13430 [Alicyclobacillus sp. SO9]